MLDLITTGNFEEFRKQFEYEELETSTAFELFSIYCIASKFIKDTINKELLEEIRTGGGNDLGIDGFVVIINGKAISDYTAAMDLMKQDEVVDVKIILIQSKLSDTVKTEAVLKFSNGIENVTESIGKECNKIIANQEILNYLNIVNIIYKNCAKFSFKEPELYGYFVFGGDSRKDANVETIIKHTCKKILDKKIFSMFEFDIIDQSNIVKYYKEAKGYTETQITVTEKLPLPEVKEISDSYLCLVSFQELKKLFIDQRGNFIHKAFYDNVRGFQGMNPVNGQILQSIKDGDVDLFTAMNNGLTIIAKDISATGTSIKMIDFQIVNGCQTCNVLFLAQDKYDIDNLKVVVKIIASEDKSVRDKIIIGNNSQTEVKREQLLSLKEIQQRIEDYYNVQYKYDRLYYERRSKQYAYDRKIQSRIITISNQITSFVSMILGKPDMINGYYGCIVENLRNKREDIFKDSNNPALYYTCALASYKMTELFSKGIIDRKYKIVRFHLLYAFRLLYEKGELTYNGPTTQKYCDSLCDVLNKKKECALAFCNASSLISAVLHRDPIYIDQQSQELTHSIEKEVSTFKAKLGIC